MSPLSDLAFDPRALHGLRQRAAENDPAVLREAARQFEALLVQAWLKSARALRLDETDALQVPDPSSRLYQELLDQHWALRLASGRGLGLAESLTRQLQAAAAPPLAAAQAALKPPTATADNPAEG